jgi:hypothetical protein
MTELVTVSWAHRRCSRRRGTSEMWAVAAIRAGELLKDGVEHGHCRCVGPSRSSKLERHDHSAIVFRPAAVIAAQTTPPSRVMLGSNWASPSSTRSLSWS